jgi:hypothetical protein
MGRSILLIETQLPAFYIRLGERAVPRKLFRDPDSYDEHKVLMTLLPNETPPLPLPHEPLPTIFLRVFHREGAAGITYISTCKTFVVKTSFSTSNSCTMLQGEAAIYERLPPAAGRPKYYGIFHLGKDGVALVLSYEGEPVFFNSLSYNHRQVA